MDKGLIRDTDFGSSKLLQHMINAGDARLVTKDIQGKLRFASKLNSKDALLLLLRNFLLK